MKLPPIGTFLVDKDSGTLCRVTNLLGDKLIIDAADSACDFTARILDLEQVSEHFCVTSARGTSSDTFSDESDKFNSPDVDSFMESPDAKDRWWELVGAREDLAKYWGQHFRDVFSPEKKRELQTALAPFNKKVKDATAAFQQACKSLPIAAQAAALAKMEQNRYLSIAEMFSLQLTGKPPSEKFMQMFEHQMARYVNQSNMEASIIGEEHLRNVRKELKYFKAKGDLKQFDLEMGVAAIQTQRALGMAEHELQTPLDVVRIAADVPEMSDPAVPLQDKINAVLDALIEEWWLTPFDAENLPSAAACQQLDQPSGPARRQAWIALDTSKDRQDADFRYRFSYWFEVTRNLLAAPRTYVSSSGAKLTDEQQAMQHIGSALTPTIKRLRFHSPKGKQDVMEWLADVPETPAKYFENLADSIKRQQDIFLAEQSNWASYLKASKDKVVEKAAVFAPSNVRTLSGRAVLDLAKSVWLTTDCADKIYDLLEQRLKISRPSIALEGRSQLGEAAKARTKSKKKGKPAANATAVRGLFDVGLMPIDELSGGGMLSLYEVTGIPPENLPVEYIPLDALAWGSKRIADDAVESYSFIQKPTRHQFALVTILVDSKQVQPVKTFGEQEAAMAALQGVTTEWQMMPEILYEKELKPRIEFGENSFMGQHLEALTKLKDILQEQDPEIQDFLKQVHQALGVGHPNMLNSLNRDLANAGTLFDFMRAFWDVAERMRVGAVSVSADRRLTEQESRYFDPSQRKPGTSMSRYDELKKIHTGPGQVGPSVSPDAWVQDWDLTTVELDELDQAAAYFTDLRTKVEEFLTSDKYATPAGYAELEKILEKAELELPSLKPTQVARAPFRPRLQLFPPAPYEMVDPIIAVEREMLKGPIEGMLTAVKSTRDKFALGPDSMSNLYSSKIGIGAENMSEIVNPSVLVQGLPVTIKGSNHVHVVVSRDSNEPMKYYLIQESQINSHDRVELTSALLQDISPIRVYRVQTGDVLEVKGALAKVVDTTSADIGVVQLQFQGSTEVVNYPVEGLDAASDYRTPYKLVQCSKDGGYVTPEDLINCPFHGAEGHLVNAVSNYDPHKRVACKPGEPELDKKFRHEYEVAKTAEEMKKLESALNALAFTDVEPEVAKHTEVLEDESGELEIGARVKKFGSTTLGTLLGRTAGCWTVAWEGGKEEKCWPQELIVITETTDR